MIQDMVLILELNNFNDSYYKCGNCVNFKHLVTREQLST